MPQWLSICFGSGLDPGVLGDQSHFRLPTWSLIFLLPITLPLCVSHEYISKIFKKEKKDFIYVFMRDTERQRYRQGENDAPCREPDVGHDSPGPRDHDLSQSRCSTTEAPRCLAESIPLLLMGLFTFLFLPISVLIVCTFLGISPILPGLPVC